jgi:hypothetical protein
VLQKAHDGGGINAVVHGSYALALSRHALFRPLNLLDTSLFVGFPGFVSKAGGGLYIVSEVATPDKAPVWVWRGGLAGLRS